MGPASKSVEEKFLSDLGIAAASCADDYFRAVAKLPPNAPDAVWAAHWQVAWGVLNEHVPDMCKGLGFDAETTGLMLACALDAFHHRVDAVNVALVERIGRPAN